MFVAPVPLPLPLLTQISMPKRRANLDVETEFRFNRGSAHLTYRGHIDHQRILNFLSLFGELRWYSIVWESSDQECSYDHTHVGCEWKKKLDRRDPRFLDIDGVHPHIQPIHGKQHAIQIWKYHEKAPVKLTRSENGPGNVLTVDTMEQIIKAPSLEDACQIAGVGPRSVTDVQCLRANRQKRQKVQPLQHAMCWIFEPPAWNVLFLSGPSGIGKTEWALAQFRSPLLIRSLETLKQFDSSVHDGLVFDDLCARDLKPEQAIMLVEFSQPSTINVKYGSVDIPAHVRKVFTTNLHFSDYWPDMKQAQLDAIRRRLVVVELSPVCPALYGQTPQSPLMTEVDLAYQTAAVPADSQMMEENTNWDQSSVTGLFPEKSFVEPWDDDVLSVHSLSEFDAVDFDWDL